MNRIRRIVFLGLLGALVAVLGAGCTNDNPLEPSGSMNISTPESQNPLLTPSIDPLQVTGRVETIDWDALQLTLAGYAPVITATADCDIALIDQGVETPIAFSDINVGDSILACGKLQDDGGVLVHRIRVFAESTCDTWDVEFRGLIASIDYAAGSFTVDDRAETILVDANTVIWTTIQVPRTSMPKATPNNGGYHVRYHSIYDTTLTFADLKVGDSVVVKADIVDASTLLAIKIKLKSECFVRCVEFTDVLTQVDVDTRTVAFETQTWIGLVCPNALLTDAAGTPLTLADYAPADLVYVKGYPLEDETLKICQMIKQ